MTPAKRSAGVVIPPCILIVAVTYGFARYSFGLFLPEIRSELAMNIAEAGAVVSISYLGYLFASLSRRSCRERLARVSWSYSVAFWQPPACLPRHCRPASRC